MKRIILLATMFAVVLGVNAQRRMQVWEGNTYTQYFTTDVDSVTFLQFPNGILHECIETHDTIRVIIKDTVYIDVCGSGVATVTTNAVTHATYNSLALGGTVRFSDYDAITERGICYATHTEPTTADNVTKAGKGTGTFSITITGLTPQTTYYLRAYAVNESGTAYGNEIVYTTPEKSGTGGGSTGTEGSLVGKFSVSADKQVYFSKGNLQYQASTNTWRFAENQTDYIGEANKNISATYDGWIDLFGWSGSTGNAKWGISTSTNTSDYTGNFVDWSTNTIGTDAPNTWRTLTGDEWYYLFYTRANAQKLFGLGSVNSVKGTIILPDSWATPSGVTFNPNTEKGLVDNQGCGYYNGNGDNYSHNTYTLSDWQKLENAGAVFLPTAGYRFGQSVLYLQERGDYWSSTANDSDLTSHLNFDGHDFDPQCNSYRVAGYSVRLVQDAE